MVNAAQVKHEFDISIISKISPLKDYTAIIIAVAHTEFLSFDFKKYKENNTIIFDAKACLDRKFVDARL